MTFNRQILPVALVAALVGGTVTALVKSHHTTEPATTDTTLASQNAAANPQPAAANTTTANNAAGNQTDQDACYKKGYAEGMRAQQRNDQAVSRGQVVGELEPVRVASRRGTRYASTYESTRRVYYDYSQPRRTFWQKHRDKLTLAMGTGGGALLGGLIGGGRGAGIGAIAGAAGSALYTYKLRHRHGY